MRKEEILHVLHAYHYYLSSLNYCKFDELTAEYIQDHWDEDYDIVEEYAEFKKD